MSGAVADACFPTGSAAFSVAGNSSAAAAGDADCGFETMIKCVHTRHLKRAALPLILETSSRYFFPHSSQMTIIAELL
jgi:hypothetical protein